MKIAIVGSGRTVTSNHIPHFSRIPDCRIVAICDDVLEWAEKVARENRIPKVYGDLRDCLQKEKVEAVSVCSIPQNHLRDVRTAFEFGCHVLLEKPMARTIEEVAAMREAQLAANRILAVVHNWKYRAGVSRLLHEVKTGALGRILGYTAAWRVDPSKDRMSSDPDHWSHKLIGGRWAETMPHNIYIAYNLLGEARLRHVLAISAKPPFVHMGAEEVAVTLEHDGAIAQLHYSARKNESQDDYMIVAGSKRVALLTPTDFQYLDIALGGKRGLVKRIREEMVQTVVAKLRRTPTPDRTGHGFIIENFVREISARSAPAVTYEEAFYTMKLTQSVGFEIESQTKLRP